MTRFRRKTKKGKRRKQKKDICKYGNEESQGYTRFQWAIECRARRAAPRVEKFFKKHPHIASGLSSLVEKAQKKIRGD